MNPIIWVIICIATLVIGFVLGVIYRKKVAEAQIAGAEEEAKRISNDALKKKKKKKREALVEAPVKRRQLLRDQYHDAV